MSGLKHLAGKVAVVTGGASGIGRGIAEALKAEGMQIVIADVEPAALDRTAQEIGAVGIRTDVSSMESVQALADQVSQEFGTVHVVCNNAGVGSNAPIGEMTPSDWQWMLGVNLMGVIHGTRAFLPALKANFDGGWIVNTASMSGFRIVPGLGGYGVTKFGIMAFSETLALELAGEGLKVGISILCPGPVHTNIKASSRNRPGALGGGALEDMDLEQSEEGRRLRWMSPLEVGDLVVRAIRGGDLYVLTHPEMGPMVEERHRAIEDAFRTAAKARA
jgi:NAD(P)-dependent dehydrogenase (short-subunit alcohol dehydrogenase family)